MIETRSLERVDIFENLADLRLEPLVAICNEFVKSAEDTVFVEGAEATYLYVLLEGEVSLHVDPTYRPERVTISVIKQPYHIFGWSGLVEPFLYTTTAKCRTDCRLLGIHGRELLTLLERQPEAGFHVMRRIAQRIGSRLRESRVALLKTL